MTDAEHRELADEAQLSVSVEPAATREGKRRFDRWAVIAFPVVLWAFATCYYGGDIGKWCDDYINAWRDPATGEYTLRNVWRCTLQELSDPYRPLCHAWIGLKATFFWNCWWLNHLFVAATHGLAAWLIWRFLRRFTRGWHAPMVAALIFLVFPLSHQIALCSTGQPTSISTITLLLLAGTYMRFARREWGWWSVLLMAALAYTIATWQEQPATSILALPLLYWALCPREEPWRVRLVRGLTPVFVCCVALLAYVAIWQVGAKSGAKGGPGSWISAADAPARVVEVSHRAVEHYRMRDILEAGFPIGWAAIGTAAGLIWIVILAIALGPWWRAWCAQPLSGEAPDAGPSPRARLGAILFALLSFPLAWLPLLLQRSVSVESRVCYYPLFLLLVVLAIVLDIALGWAARWRAVAAVFKVGLGAAVVWAGLYAAVCFVCMQSMYRERYRLDQDQMAQLQAMLPDPAPNTVFVPLGVEDAPAHTGRIWFDHTVRGALEMPWTVTPIVQQSYKRRDVFATHFSRFHPTALRGGDQAALRYEVERYLRKHFAPDPAGGVRLPWAQVVPFVVDEEGRVHLVSTIEVDRGGHDDLHISFEQVTAALERNKLPPRRFILRNADVYAGTEPISGWRWTTTGQSAELTDRREWRSTRRCVGTHPLWPGGKDQAALVTTLEESAQPARLYFRATFPEWAINEREWGDGVELLWYLDGEKDTPLATLRLLPPQVAQERRWIPVAMELPPLDRPRELHVEVGPGPAGNVNYDGCLVTGGWREVLDAAADE